MVEAAVESLEIKKKSYEFSFIGDAMLDLIKVGDMSTAVYKMQKALRERGFGVSADGRFGPGTARAVADFQRGVGLTPDSIAGPRTIQSLGLDLRPTVLSSEDYEYAAGRLGCETAVIRAFTKVEAPRGGFNPDGTPVILFERHYFYKQFMIYKKPGQSSADRDALRQQIRSENRDICYPYALTFAKTRKNSAGQVVAVPAYDRYGSVAQQYTRLERARQFSDSAALESASWGKFQIMGENWSRIGWSSVQAFYRAMCASERDHLDAFIGFIGSKPGLREALRLKKWRSIAMLYNGSGQIDYYAPRLEAAYRNG